MGITGVLLTCHGSVERLDDLPELVSNIRHGRAAPPELLAEVRRRYEAIGGSPLMAITRQQASALEDRLRLPVRVAGRLFHPYPKAVLERMASEGVRTVISLPLAPQSVHVYHASVREAAAAHPELDVRCVPPWGTEPALLDAFEQAIAERLLDTYPAESRAAVAVILTAHSLPQRVILAGDPYERQFREMAELVGARVARWGNPVRVAFQSQGMAGPGARDAWLGPDLPTTFAELVARGVREVLLAPIGFVADHVETLYDLDVEAQELGRAAGLSRVARAAAMNTRPRFIDALEAVVRRELPPPA